MEGTAYTFGDEINTDLITPDTSETVYMTIEERAELLMDPIRPGFADEISEGDFIVAGRHFGSGSSRESAPAAINASGIGAVIAESFSRIFYRNSVTIGLPVMICPGISDAVSDGDELTIELESGEITNQSTGETLQADPIPDALVGIYEAGGLLAHYKKHGPDGLEIPE
jgi:3-isopropylmalate/(R)-2-methylmalate dehydratase small subunit